MLVKILLRMISRFWSSEVNSDRIALIRFKDFSLTSPFPGKAINSSFMACHISSKWFINDILSNVLLLLI